MIANEHQEFFSFLAEAAKPILYFKILIPLAGSVTACILMQQLEYWFQKHPNGFYKFLEAAPSNRFYKPGDSWTEELGFGVDEFRGAFDKIGVRYISKTQYQTAAEKGDPFKGLFYCSYHDKQKGLTVYLRNHRHVNESLRKLLNFQFAVNKDPQFISEKEDNYSVPGSSSSSVTGNSQFTGDAVTGNSELPVTGNSQFTVPRNSPSPLYTEITLHRVLTEEIKDPPYPPSGSDVTNPEPRLSSLSEGENSITVDFWEEIVQDTLQSDSQNPPSRPQENNGQDLIVEYDTPRSLEGAFTEGKSPKSDSTAETHNKTSLLLFSNPGVAVYSVPPDDCLQPKKKRTKHVYSEDFQQFWAIYPRDEDKLKAFKAWQKIDFEEVTLEFILDSLRKQMVYHFQVKRKDIDVFKHAATWINGECWNNKVPDPRLADLKPKTSAEIREEQKQAEKEARKAEFRRLMELDKTT